MTQPDSTEYLRFGTTNLDPAVLKHLPPKCKVVSTEAHGVSFWATTGRINVELQDGSPKSFFMKILAREDGESMARGEFISMSKIAEVTPEFVPKPIAWGKFESVVDTAFFLCEFREMTDDMPEPEKFAASLSKLHQKSVSPNGKFGFEVPTYAGNLPQYVSWEDSWEVFFTKSLKNALDLFKKNKVPPSELKSLEPVLFRDVIPRLLRPLETGGRTIKPSLVHGDLWYANSGTSIPGGEPLVFDACCFYAHHEYEFGQWMPACNRFDTNYIEKYNSFVPVSAPEVDFQGRLNLYRLRFDTHVAALFHENETLRQQVVDVMRKLVDEYGKAN